MDPPPRNGELPSVLARDNSGINHQYLTILLFHKLQYVQQQQALVDLNHFMVVLPINKLFVIG